ncbi:hypothetical protein DH86_00002932, partial [Scytalidium sp. 3C]
RTVLNRRRHVVVLRFELRPSESVPPCNGSEKDWAWILICRVLRDPTPRLWSERERLLLTLVVFGAACAESRSLDELRPVIEGQSRYSGRAGGSSCNGLSRFRTLRGNGVPVPLCARELGRVRAP